jgi:predicted metal-dependent enzyme (double-stranded beta helix superfamily)
MREFIEFVRETQANENDPHEIVRKVRPVFAKLMADAHWLPGKYQEPAEGESGMGSRIGMWLLYRAGDGNLAFSALVLPSGTSTPVHDHLAWGLVGLYRGLQYEEVFRRDDDGSEESRADLTVKEKNNLRPGDFYELLPDNDIHQVTTTSPFTSVSLHLLGNDNGCIWRHKFHPHEHRVEPFKSGWLNVACKD